VNSFGGRRAGVLLHPTALPGTSGALGQAARDFIDWLPSAGFSVWQVLPLGPVNATGSPYWARSDAAFNPQLIDWSEALRPEDAPGEFVEFCIQNAYWLDSYVLFAALCAEQGGMPWWLWPAPLRDREPAALGAARARLAVTIRRLQTEQWLASRQWLALRIYAAQRGVYILGDLPIYVSPDSVSVWAHRQQFQLDRDGQPSAVAGVPPDYFAVDGQLWGNPLYDWQQAGRDNFAFWRERLRPLQARFDWLRIDHFRGLESYWSVPATATSARAGRWVPAPGAQLLAALRREYPELQLIAEDLGVITPEVHALRDSFGLPGMRVLQFGFDGSANSPHLPHNLVRNSVVYTGTHDNDTTLGWYRQIDTATRERVDFVLRSDRIPMPEALLRAALFSVADLAILPVQDLLGCGSEARFNTPGTIEGNWRWRMWEGALDAQLTGWLRALNEQSDRCPRAAAADNS
jgi:4-alpha-glucanotransferase